MCVDSQVLYLSIHTAEIGRSIPPPPEQVSRCEFGPPPSQLSFLFCFFSSFFLFSFFFFLFSFFFFSFFLLLFSFFLFLFSFAALLSARSRREKKETGLPESLSLPLSLSPPPSSPFRGEAWVGRKRKKKKKKTIKIIKIKSSRV